MFAFEYGYTIDQFLDLTLTQIHALATAIDKRNTTRFHAVASFHASIHGAKIKSLEELMDVEEATNFDKQTDDALTEYALKRIKELGR